MKSIKRGRGPSMMGGAVSIAMAVFGFIWIAAAVSMGAPVFFPLFGLVFIGIAVSQAVYNFKNATGEKRYSEYDIVDGEEEPDPLNERFGAAVSRTDAAQSAPRHAGEAFAFCPYCGEKLDDEDNFCGKCGKRIR